MSVSIKKILVTLGIIGVAYANFPLDTSLPILIDSKIQDKTSREKSDIKSTEILKQDFVGNHIDTKYNLTMQIQSIEKIEGGIQIFARGYKNGQQLGFGAKGTTDLERFRIYNPPIMVWDASGNITREFTNKEGQLKQIKLREDPKQAILDVLALVMKITGRTDTIIVPGSVGNTTSTFFPEAGNPGSVTADGTMYNGTDSWANNRAGAGSGVFGTSAAETATGSSGDGGSYMYRARFGFDTSAIPDTDTISSATFTVTTNGGSTGTMQQQGLIQATPSADNTIAAGDYDQPTANGFTEGASRITPDDTAGTANNWTLNATGQGFITKTGVTNLGLRYAGDLDNASTGSNNYQFLIRWADTAGTASDPLLTVIHAAPSVSAPDQSNDFINFE
jgi:hypothetical protein